MKSIPFDHLGFLGVVVAVLDGIDRSSRKLLADLGPFVSNSELFREQNAVFFFGPLGFFETWIKMVGVAITDAFTGPARKNFGNVSPSVSLVDFLENHFVFGGPPATTDDARSKIL